MKLFSKKLVGLLICLALVLAMLPMAVFAADTYVLVDGVMQTITIPAGGSATIEVDATASDMNLLINGNRMYYDWYLDTGRMQMSPNPGGVVETTLPAGGVYTLNIVNASEEAEQVLDVTAAGPKVGTEDHPAELVMGENVATLEERGVYIYSWTATENGAFTIAVDTEACSDWTVTVNGELANGEFYYGDTLFSDSEPVVSSHTVNVHTGDVYTIIVGTASYAAGTVVFNASFVAGEVEEPEQPEQPEVPEEPAKEEYVISDVILVLGDNSLTLDPSAVTTIFEFCPDETGIYSFIANDLNALVGYWGAGSFFVQDHTADKTSSLECTLESVGPSIMIGVSGVESVVLTIEKVGEYTPVVIPKDVYENEHVFVEFDVAEDAEIIDIDVSDDVEDVVVVGEDGFFHYGTADGPLVVIDLKKFPVSISGAAELGQLNAVIYDENGTAIQIIDYNAAMMEYYEMGLYPVTEELATMLQQVGESKDWWDEGGFVYHIGEAPEDPSISWLGVCSYVEDYTIEFPGTPDEPEIPDEPETPDVPSEPETPSEPEDPEDTEQIPVTGDIALAGLIAAMVVSGTAIVVLKKKED